MPMGSNKINETGEELLKCCSSVSMDAVHHIAKKLNGNMGDGAYVTSMGALGCLFVASMSYVKRDYKTHEEIENATHEELLSSLIRPEGVQFACLVASFMMTEHNAKTGSTSTEFGPPVLWEALKAWELLNPGKDADKYFDETMLKAARKAGQNSEVPFTDFLAKRAQANQTPSSKTLN